MVLALKAIELFTGLFFVGYALAYLLMRSMNKKFYKSSLYIKTLLWIPIFAVFIVFAESSFQVKAVIIIFLIAMMFFEAKDRLLQSHNKWLVASYACAVSCALVSSLYVASIGVEYLYLIAFASVLSDVFAFFFGNFFGKHSLPEIFNINKSYEGIIGQFVGAFVGVLLVAHFLLLYDEISVIWFLPIAIGAVLGDLSNSYVKRKESIKDWSNNLPGHGGYLDRLASLAYSFAFVALVIAIK